MVGYGRVSTQEQHPEVQEAALRAAGCDVVFTERTSSRVPMAKRKDLQAALAAMRPGDTLVSVRLDRLARSVQELWQLLNLLEERGMFLRITEQSIDTSTPEGRLLFSMLGAVAQFERDLTVARTRESIAHRRATGGDLGGRRRSYTTAQMELVHRLRDEGRSLSEVAQATGLSRTVVHRITGMQPLGQV
jgi:DNA invertase Pin-like site-specific DNA recombinase